MFTQDISKPQDYPVPTGVHVIPDHLLDLRPDAEIDHDLLHPPPVKGDKNVWFFWHSGYSTMHPYGQRNVRAWHRRLVKLGWVVRVLDRKEGSPHNIANYVDVQDPDVMPVAFRDGTVTGDYALQHTSDLVRWPLLLKYGGVYADVGLLQIGDLDRLWNETVGNPDSPYEVISYDGDETDYRTLTNYFVAAKRNNPMILRWHRLLLALWAEDGGKTSTEGMHASPLLKGLPLMGGSGDGGLSITQDDGTVLGHAEVSKLLTDYITQGHAMTMVMNLVDQEDEWDGPKYVHDHVYTIEFMVGSQYINHFTEWNGQRAFNLMSLKLPEDGEKESDDQAKAREIVEACLGRSFSFKLATGLILKVMGDTLSSLWRKHVGSDDVPGTYAHWLRYGTVHWTQDELPKPVEFPLLKPLKTGRLLEGA